MLETNTTVQSYNATAQEYAEQTKNFHPEKEAEKFLSHIPKGASILDLGCGPGRDAAVFTNKGYEVTGIDPSGKLLEIARDAAPFSIFQHGYAEDIPFMDEEFSGVWACASLLHVPRANLPRALNEVYRVSRPGAIFAPSFKRGEGEEMFKDNRYGGVEKFFSYYQRSEIEEMLENSGFNNIDYWGTDANDSYATNPWMTFFCSRPQTS